MLADASLREARSPQGCLGARDATHRYFNTGVWAVRPNATEHASLMRFLRSGRSRCYDGDQSAALGYFAGRRNWPVLPLHAGYNAKVNIGLRKCLVDKIGLKPADLHVVHWTGPNKPVNARPSKVTDDLESRAQRAYMSAHASGVARYAAAARTEANSYLV